MWLRSEGGLAGITGLINKSPLIMTIAVSTVLQSFSLTHRLLCKTIVFFRKKLLLLLLNIKHILINFIILCMYKCMYIFTCGVDLLVRVCVSRSVYTVHVLLVKERDCIVSPSRDPAPGCIPLQGFR